MAANLLSSAFSICQSEFPTSVSITALATACSSQCSQINQAFTLCDEDSCFCPTLLSAGSQCSNCLATVDITQAINIGSAMNICQSEFAIPSGTPAFPTSYFIPSMPASTASSTTSSVIAVSTTIVESSSKGFPPAAIRGIVGGFVALLLIASLCILCFTGRHKSQNAIGQSTVDPIDIKGSPPAYIDAGMDAKTARDIEIPSAALRPLNHDADDHNRNTDLS
jgi:hypothetical protein